MSELMVSFIHHLCMKLTASGNWVSRFPLRFKYLSLVRVENDLTIAPSSRALYDSANLLVNHVLSREGEHTSRHPSSPSQPPT